MPVIMYFPYFGPNRRCDQPVVEIRLDFDADDEHAFPQQLSDIGQLLLNGGILKARENFPETALPDDRMAWYASLLAQTALLFQRKAGHRVNFFAVSRHPDQNRCTALVEHEHCDVGMTAVKLAVETLSGKRDELTGPFRLFSEFARDRLLPPETRAIIEAARRLDIPCFQLDWPPLAGKFKTSSFRVRPNGLLLLGHGAHAHVLDGTFCQHKSGDYLVALLRNLGQRMALLKKLGLPVVQADDQGLAELAQFHLLAINGQVTTVVERPGGRKNVVDEVHASCIDTALAIHREAGLAPVAVTLLARDISKPLAPAGGGVVDFELAPDLDRFLGQCQGRGPERMDAAAEALLHWLFPDPGSARMPVIAVTGTNGKTTSCRMISHILQQSGRKPGLVCTDGIFLNQKQVSQGDAGTFIGHARALTSKQVNVAVLETHHRGIAIRGFAFQWCDVAVCLNVTEDHLRAGEIETIAEMATVKRALVERARYAAVLNADDAHCVAMLDSVVAEKTCLVSLQSSVGELGLLMDKDRGCFCVLELIQDSEWLVIHDGQRRLPLMPVAQIPATFDGTARFNVSNAMHAAAATFLVGTGIDTIRAALGGFSAGPEMTPGRMNVFDELPFRVIMDFAHNPDGMQKVCEFVDRQKVTGRKLIAFSGKQGGTEEKYRNLARTVAGHYDFYFCKEYMPREGFETASAAPVLQQELLAMGVAENQTAVAAYGKAVIFEIFDACEPGDLLVMLVGFVEMQRLPLFIREYAQRQA